jgi:hypothetical protein
MMAALERPTTMVFCWPSYQFNWFVSGCGRPTGSDPDGTERISNDKSASVYECAPLPVYGLAGMSLDETGFLMN